MAAQVFWAVFYSSRQPSQIGPTADFDGAAIPPPLFSMVQRMHVDLATEMFEVRILSVPSTFVKQIKTQVIISPIVFKCCDILENPIAYYLPGRE